MCFDFNRAFSSRECLITLTGRRDAGNLFTLFQKSGIIFLARTAFFAAARFLINRRLGAAFGFNFNFGHAFLFAAFLDEFGLAFLLVGVF